MDPTKLPTEQIFKIGPFYKTVGVPPSMVLKVSYTWKTKGNGEEVPCSKANQLRFGHTDLTFNLTRLFVHPPMQK